MCGSGEEGEMDIKEVWKGKETREIREGGGGWGDRGPSQVGGGVRNIEIHHKLEEGLGT